MVGVIEEAASEQDTSEDHAQERLDHDTRLLFAAERRDQAAEPHHRWLPNPDQVWIAARILSGAILFVWLIAWPIGTTMANFEATGVVRLGFGYSGAVFMLALTNAALVLAGGYLLRAALRLEATADRLGDTVRRIEPRMRAEMARADVEVLGTEVDQALQKLASAEQQIRVQVEAIDAATEALKVGSDETSERLATERQALIDATSIMNKEAEAFAKALSQRNKASDGHGEAIQDQITRLEAVSQVSAEQFEALRQAMEENAELLRQPPEGFVSGMQDSTQTLRTAQKDLLDESERLRSLIEQQKERADQLGRSLAEQSDKLTRREQTAKTIGTSWRKILEKVERQVRTAPADQVPVNPIPIDPSATERERMTRLYRFTMTMKANLFDVPSHEELDRFEQGDRSLFAYQLLESDQIELRSRLENTMANNPGFDAAADDFLSDFDQLLAPIMSGDPHKAEQALHDTLRTPLGQVYVRVGTAKGHFG
ncbi:MAG: hypothetical protein AAF788_00955 [Pseudomonadota bacterium]